MLTMLIGSATLSVGIGAIAAANAPATATKSAPKTRLGASISDDLKQRATADAGQASALDLREQTIRAAQARLNASLKAKQEAEKASPDAAGEAGAGTGTSPGSTPDQYDTLARIYQAMKPAKAAPVFAQLDLEVQYLVAKKMRERSTAMILAAMDPQAAARISMALASGKKPMPRP
jgi:flagellar motility protein MotE (MotC chaperone)